MTANPHGGRTRLLVLVGLSAVLVPSLGVLAKLETWRDESASAFSKGKRQGVVVSDAGRVRLGHALEPLGKFEAARVWDLARGPGGDVFAATGDAGKVFRFDPKGPAEWSVVYAAADTQALSLAALADGRVFVGTGPSGQVVEINGSKTSAAKPGPDVRYVWDLATDTQGNLYAATGPLGQLWKRNPAGSWSLLLDTRHAHLLCVAVGPDGSVFAGSDGEGLVYKVAAGGKASVLYDASQNEVRCLLVGTDGTLYAGTAAESGGGSGRGPSMFPNNAASIPGVRAGESRLEAASEPSNAQEPPPRPAPGKSQDDRPRSGGGSSTTRPASPGENAVYKIDPGGAVLEVFRSKVLVFALASRGDRLLIGTGPEGQIYEVRGDGRESTSVARLDSGHALALLSEPDGGVLIGTADPGSVVRLGTGYLTAGTLTSEVRDAKLVSRFGALGWKAELPTGTRVAVRVRTGNVSEPDSTWSDWSAEQTDPADAFPQVPVGRFAQYRAALGTKDAGVTPELFAVSFRYQSTNLPPEISKLDVPDVSALDGAAKQTRLTFRWDVNDPNDDDLDYRLSIRKDGWPDWIKLTDQPLSERSFGWDSTSMPPGTYRVRLAASDRPSNNPADALTRERVSEAFVIDHQAPEVDVKTSGKGASAALRDKLTRIVKAAYAIDGGDWVPVFPADGLFDSPNETVEIPLPDVKAGRHVLMVRATDAAGNVGTGDALLDVR